MHSVVVWTKDPSNLLHHARLRAALAGVGQVFVHWTVTGLGGTFLEPHVPPPDAQLALLDAVVASVGDPRRVHWRYDPLLSVTRGEERLTNLDLELFRSLATAFARAGVPAVHTSFVTPYPKVMRRLAAAGVRLEVPSAEEQTRFLHALSAALGRTGHGTPHLLPAGLPHDAGALTADSSPRSTPRRRPCRTDRARGQRELCGCTASLDIGRYLPCPNRCLYCYAHPAG